MYWRRMGFALLLGALFCLALPAFGDSNARIVRLSYLNGNVEVDRGDGRGFQRAILNMPIVQGTTVATRDGATAEVEFEDGSTVRLAPDTTVAFPNLSLRDSGERVTTADLSAGTAYFDLKDKKDDFRVTSAGQTITTGKASRFRVASEKSEVRVSVFKGEAEVHTAKDVAKVKKNETFLADSSDPARDQLAKGIEPETYDSWAQQRDQYQQTYASNHRYGYSPAYSYGWSDLNYFGSFYDYPGYGYLWRPFGVSSMWDPFADGAWMAYPGYGWMFVSAYPWGWTPYRYGSWLFVPGFGWAWQPGYWNRWYAVPVISSAPAGFVAPQPPSGGKGIVTIGQGPMHGVNDPRFGKWMNEAQTQAAGHHAGHHPAVTPVPSTSPTTAKTPQTTAPATTAQPEPRTQPVPRTQPHQERQAPRPQPQAPAPQAAPRQRPAPPPLSTPHSFSSGGMSGGGGHVSGNGGHVLSGHTGR